MSDLAAAHQARNNREPHSSQHEDPPSRRRVTDVPDANMRWFMEQDGHDSFQSRELARAELTAERDGYVIRWVHPWVCQILEPVADGGLIESAEGVFLDGTPDTDPRAREIEQQLLREAGLHTNGDAEPTSVKRDERGGILRSHVSHHISWERVSVCQLFGPDGTTLIDQSDGCMLLDPATNPRARGIAAELLLAAGV